jgi:hypothetical protein
MPAVVRKTVGVLNDRTLRVHAAGHVCAFVRAAPLGVEEILDVGARVILQTHTKWLRRTALKKEPATSLLTRHPDKTFMKHWRSKGATKVLSRPIFTSSDFRSVRRVVDTSRISKKLDVNTSVALHRTSLSAHSHSLFLSFSLPNAYENAGLRLAGGIQPERNK